MLSEHKLFHPNESERDFLNVAAERKLFKSRGTRTSPQSHEFIDYFGMDNMNFGDDTLDVNEKWESRYMFDSSFSLNKDFELKTESINKIIGTSPPNSFEQYKFNIGSQTSTSTEDSMESRLFSPNKSKTDDVGVDGLKSNLVALDLNVDNHIGKSQSSFPKFEYNLSGVCSMTPNPRTQYRSAEGIGEEGNHDNFPFKMRTLNSKIQFDDSDSGNSFELPFSHNLVDENEYDYSCKPYEQQQFIPQSFTSVQPVQQIILPNGMPAMVVPMYNMSNEKTFKKNEKYKKFSGQYAPVQQTSRARFKNRPPYKKIAAAIPNDQPLSSFSGRFLELSRDQNGCRYLQYKVDAENGALDIIIGELDPNIQEIMVDPFGNYLFQKIIERVSKDKRFEILLKVRPIIIDAGLNLHGTRSVQKFVELCTDSDEQTEVLLNCFHGHITKLSMDTNGNHVVQRCLQFFNAQQKIFIYDSILTDMMQITKHRHGCCVFQRCLDAANAEQKRKLISMVVQNTYALVKDPFGNYVVQYVLDMCNSRETENLIKALLGKLPELSMQKFSSNVIEKCLVLASENMKNKIVEEITLTPKLKLLLLDQYANYVIQRALGLASDDKALKLVMKVIPHLKELSHNPTCARRVASKALKRFPHLYSDSRLSVHVTGLE